MKTVKKPASFLITAILLWAATICLFTVVAPWTAAIEPALIQDSAKDDALNSKWVAAVKEHGVWKEWKRGTVSQRPEVAE